MAAALMSSATEAATAPKPPAPIITSSVLPEADGTHNAPCAVFLRHPAVAASFSNGPGREKPGLTKARAQRQFRSEIPQAGRHPQTSLLVNDFAQTASQVSRQNSRKGISSHHR